MLFDIIGVFRCILVSQMAYSSNRVQGRVIGNILVFLTKYFVFCLEKSALAASVYLECQPRE